MEFSYQIQKQINELNTTTKCRLASSKIHGVGVFTIVNVRKGEKLFCKPRSLVARTFYSLPYENFDKLLPDVKELILDQYPSVINGGMFCSPNDVWLLSFMNHSENPNYDIPTDTALCDIALGEEVTEDYRTMPNWEKVYEFLKNNKLLK